ncbi:MAG TPA: Hsp20/alpha crystallin family protein [Nitrosopumilaceae archaeon]|jgi:HSP20 family protein|nr:Hsp20/alpha crystallin family protein [Nitrosopumilaceae archaeon]
MTLVKSNGNLFPTLLSDLFDNGRFLNNRWFEKEFDQSLPAVNIKENSKEFAVEFAAPGFKKSDFKINVEENVLTISAEKESEKNEESESYTRKEFSYNSFSRSFTLPQTVIADKIDAKYNDGILKLSIPKKEETKTLPKKEIKVA